ncbi:MAG: PEP-CTERM sorting domain-containing protein [Azoarcus sp.]|jgi:hypothetical protein|nr:PEP-CTERM sorting domain-containing protein [Azoarcus sp.]MDX9839809.1 PEP-CTERM sorting domain-containing protein [Azoarcus sp.]
MISRATIAAAVLGAASLVASSSALAGLVYDEAASGDFSNAPLSPTALGPLAVGTSTVFGNLLNTSPTEEDGLDVFSFVVAVGTEVSKILFGFNASAYPGGANVYLVGGPNSAGTSLGSLNSSNASLTSGDDLFTNATFGFGGPLTEGTYTFDLRGFGAGMGLDSYSLDFVVADLNAPQTVPEPSSILLVGLGVLGLSAARARRRRTGGGALAC